MLLDTVRRTIRRHTLAGVTTRVVVALSGGSDSVALAYLLRELAAASELAVAGLAHFNHQLRAQADRDERFCVSLAEALGWPIVVEREDVHARAEREQRSIEDAAHIARHEFFDRALAHYEADCVAVGHTRDDQAETFLLRLLRGAGPRGLAAMHPRHGRLVRPLLDCRRTDLLAYLDQRRIAHVEDETNSDVNIPRNRVRAELLPLIEARFNPAIVDVLADQAELARDEWLWMQSQLEPGTLNPEPGTLNPEPGTLNLAIPALVRAPLALRRLAVWRAMTLAAGGRPVSFGHVEAAIRLIGSPGGSGPIDAPGHSVERIGARLVLRKRDHAKETLSTRSTPSTMFRYPLSVPGEVRLPEAGCIVSAELAEAGTGVEALRAIAGNRAAAVVQSDGWTGPLAVRNRRPGDRFRPLGLDGQKKLQDFFVDRKVARHERDSVPLVVDSSDRIVWVAGHGIDEAFRVTDASQAVVILKLKQV
jgi:tRNA(Ile)-lysidine synthase